MKILFKNPANDRPETANKEHLAKHLAKKTINIIVKFDTEKIIGLNEVKRLLSLYKEMLDIIKTPKDRKTIGGNFNFLMSNRIENFDLTFIAALNLFKLSFEKIVIRLAFSDLSKKPEASECFYRFGQFGTASFLAYGKEVFKIMRGDKPVDPNSFLENLSGYLPFIYVNETSFENLFQRSFRDSWEQWWETLDPDALVSLKHKSHQAEMIYKELRTHVIENIDFKGNAEQNILNFYTIYLFNAVRKFHFIKRVLKNQIGKSTVCIEKKISIDETASLGIGLSREADQEYEGHAQAIFDQILEKPPVFVMLFSYFIEMFYAPSLAENASYAEKIKTRIEFISNIFYFTDEIFYGLRELAKNIIEHSSNHRGVIIGRALVREYLPGLKKGMFIENFLRTGPGDVKDFIDFIVLDDGNRGIIEQTILNLESLKNEFKKYPDMVGKFVEDIHNLKSGNITLDDFFNPEEIKLNYQDIRSALSLGLLIFSHLVLENNGYMMVSSPHEGKVPGMALFKSWAEKQSIKEIVPLGTFYNIVFPKKLKRPPAPRSETIPFEMPSGESAFNTLLKQIHICKGSIGKNSSAKGTVDHRENRCFIDSPLETGLIKDKSDIDAITVKLKECDKCRLKRNSKILAIDLKMAYKFDHSDLFKSLARIQQTRDIKSIIVYNVKEEIVNRFIDVFKIFRKMNRKIGSSDHFVLFYYLPAGPVAKYFSFLLAGEGLEDMCWINEKIAKTTYSQSPILTVNNGNGKKPSRPFEKNFYLNALFTRDGHLLPFDVLIKTRNLTLFERNVFSNLRTPGMHPTSPSYMFEDAHMRLGSKIHLTHFFYARRVFQNSFYSLRFAYLVCRYIDENIDNWKIREGKNYKPLTILGYGLYSELLISNVTMFLQGLHPNTKWEVNHAVIDDAEKLEPKGKISSSVITLIPISSTLSTSLKIEMQLRKAYPDSTVIGTPINMLIVGNGDLEKLIADKIRGLVIDPIVSHFWKELDVEKKMITTRSPGRLDKFFLYLPSKWYLPRDCELCFPQNPTDETVLFEVDKVSVTPSLIYDLPLPKAQTPLARDICFGGCDDGGKDQGKAVITENILLYGHISRGSNHFLYHIESPYFLKENEEELKNWLREIKEKLKKTPKIFDSKVILIAPTHFTNADFINRVNEIVFNDVATLFHYDQDEDYIQNLKSFFGQDIGADAYVFFIDDAMCSGTTFEKLNNFVKYARGGTDSRGVDGAIVLINRLIQDKYSVLVRELGKVGFFAFIDLEVPIMIDSEKFCHLCSEKTRYEKMLSETLLDSIRILIRIKIIKLKTKKYEEKDKDDLDHYKDIDLKYIPKEKCLFANPEKKAHYLNRMEYIHKFYRAFSDDGIKSRFGSVFREEKSLEELCKIADIPYTVKLSEDEKVDLIKILSYPYFVYHKEIRKYIFRIVITELEKTIRTLVEEELQKGDINTFRYMKFLINRGALLRANYLIREEVIKEIFLLYDRLQYKLSGKDEQETDIDMYTIPPPEKKRFLESLHGFVDYYMMAVKEVSWFNEANSLKLEETLTHLQRAVVSDKETLSALVHSLRIENIPIPYRFLKSLEKEIEVFDLDFSEQSYDTDIERLSGLVISYCKEDSYRSEPLLSFLGFKTEEEKETESEAIEALLETDPTFRTKILPMILLKAFFLHKKREKRKKPPVKLEMDYILYCLCKMLDINPDTGGASSVVRYMKDVQPSEQPYLFTIGHIGKNSSQDSSNWKSDFASKIFSGYVPSSKSLPLTYVQLLKEGENHYIHHGEEIETIDISGIEQFKDMNRILFLRIADDDLNSTARGMIVLYDKESKIIPPENLRYALILKKDIFDFIEKNYESYSLKLYEEKTRQLEELEALNLVITKITSASGLEEVYRAIQDTKINIHAIDQMCLLNKKGNEYVPIINCSEQEAPECEKCKKQKLTFFQSGTPDISYQPYYSPDAENDPNLDETKGEGLKTKFIVPLVFKQELLGILDIGSKTRDALSHFEQNLLSSLGAQVAIAINNQLKQEKREEIYRDISHSLNTYLTTMRGYSQMLVKGKVKDESRREDYLKMIYGDTLALSNSVDEISSLANMDQWESSSISDRIEIRRLIKELADKNEFLFEEKQLKLNIPGPEVQVFVRANKHRLEESLQSLINNAIKFSETNKNIDIRVLTCEDYVSVSIKDEGYGIEKDDLGRVFEKYERGRNAKERKITGTGIGLAVVKSIIEKHSGDITVESEPGIGSTFTIKLPILKENASQDINKQEDKK